MNELISVIMPAYNSEKYIGDAITSILKQTYDNYELIIVDDCSTDNTANIIKGYMSQNNKIRVIKNSENIGVAQTRNKGVSEAKGDWIAFLDSDDLWKNNKLERQLKLAQSKQCRFLFTASTFIDRNGQLYNWIFEIPDQVCYKELLKQNVISCSSVLIKKELMVKYKMENDAIHEDFGTWLRILKEEQFAYGLNEPLLLYRIHSNSKSGNKLKSLLMAYKTYRFVGLNFLHSIYNLSWYIVKGMKKYRAIKG